MSGKGTRLSASRRWSESRAVVPAGREQTAPISASRTSPTRSKYSSSLEPKWLKIVLTDTSAESAIWARVTSSKPCLANRRVATSEISCRVRRFLRSRRPAGASVMYRAYIFVHPM